MSAPVFNQNPTVMNRPLALKDAQGDIIPSTFNNLSFRGDYAAGANLVYAGYARPGSATSAAVWQISMMTYDGSGHLLSVVWPQNNFGKANNDFQFVWDNRASYTYS